MFKRNITKYLLHWKKKDNRKPLVIRGARQVGKTVAVKMFAEKNFNSLIYLNLDKEDNLAMFQRVMSMSDLIQLIQLQTGKKIIPGATLLFIDEIQNSGVAMTQLRYFYEEIPQLHVIAAGSLLEVKLKKEGFSFPVGRVEYCYMHPVTFDEFLNANNDSETHKFISELTVDSFVQDEIHCVLMKKYFDYLLVGGMPEAVAEYVKNKNFIDIDNIYEAILTSFKDDVAKYSTMAKAGYLRHVIENSPRHAGQIIKYEKFGESGFRSREMKEAFDILDKAMIISRVYSSSSRELPIINNLRKSPKLFFLDIGLVNYSLGLRENILNIKDLNVISKGQIAEQTVGQAIYALSNTSQTKISYWYRDKNGSVSEVDFIIPFGSRVIPIEVKSGMAGRLKSLHKFMEEYRHNLAIRVCSNKLKVETVNAVANKRYKLISMPFYLLHRLYDFLSED